MNGRTGPWDSHPAPSHVLQLEIAFAPHTFSCGLGSLLGALFLLHAGLGGVHSSFSLLGNFLDSTAQLLPVIPNARICLQLLSQISDIAPESHRPSVQERSADRSSLHVTFPLLNHLFRCCWSPSWGCLWVCVPWWHTSTVVLCSSFHAHFCQTHKSW